MSNNTGLLIKTREHNQNNYCFQTETFAVGARKIRLVGASFLAPKTNVWT